MHLRPTTNRRRGASSPKPGQITPDEEREAERMEEMRDDEAADRAARWEP